MFKRKSVATQWLRTYSFLLIIPIVISGIIFIVLGKNAEEETYKTNMMMLDTIRADIDDSLMVLKRLCLEITMDGDLKKTLKAFDESHPEGMVQASKLWNRAKTLVAQNDFVDEAYIGFVQHNIALYTNGGIHSFEMVNDIVFGKNGVQHLLSVLEKNPKGAFCNLHITESGKSRNMVCYVGKIPSSILNSNIQGIVVICADMNSMVNGIVEMSEIAERDFAILDEKNEIIFSSNNFPGVDVSKRNEMMYVGQKNIVSFLELETTNWCCVAAAPKEDFLENVNEIRFLCIIGIIFSMILGGIYAIYMLKRNYMPVNNILKLTESQRRKSILNEENEYEIVFDVLSSALKEKNAAEIIARERGEIIKNNYFISLLQKGFAERLQEKYVADLSFLSESFAVVIFNIINYEVLFCDEEEMSLEQKKETAHFIIENIMTEVIGRFHLCHFVKIGELPIAIVNFNIERENPQRDLVESINSGCSAIEEKFNFITNVIVSNIYEGQSKICESYREALEVLEYVKISGLTGVILCEEINIKNECYYYYPIEKDVELSNVIKMGALDKAKNIVEEIFRYNFEEKKMTVKAGRCLIVDIVSTLLKITNDENMRVNIAEICYMQNDIEKAKAEIISVVDVLCKQNISNLEKITPGVEAVKRYIEEHYSDPELTIQTLGKNFGWAPYYLSRSFKNSAGIGVLDYLRHIRVEKAKEIMKENPIIKLEDLAEAVGLNGTRAIARAFKQELGILPGEYRKTIGKEK